MLVIESKRPAPRDIATGIEDRPRAFEPFMYRGVVYLRGPVRSLVYRGRVLPLLARMRQLEDEVKAEGATRAHARRYRALEREAWGLVKGHVRPAVPGLRRLLWPLLPNPFRSDAGELLGILVRGTLAMVGR